MQKSFRSPGLIWLCAFWCICSVRAVAELADSEVRLLFPNSSVYAVVRDENDLMWIGARTGLYMYDGYTFTRPYRELTNVPVTQIFADTGAKQLWIGTRRGVYLTRDRKIKRVDTRPDTAAAVVQLLQLSGSRVVLSYHDGDIELIERDGSIRHVASLRKMTGGPSYAVRMAQDSEQGIWLTIYGRSGLYRLSLDGGGMDTVLASGINSTLLKIFGDTVVLLRQPGGIVMRERYTMEDRTPRVLQELNRDAGATAMSFSVEKFADELYVARSTDIFGYAKHYQIHVPTGRGRLSYRRDYDEETGWRHNFCIYKDPQGIIWIGTESGLIRIVERRRLFTQSLILPDKRYRASLRGMIEDETGDLYVGSYTGLYHHDRKAGVWWHYASPQFLTGTERRIAPVLALLDDKDGYIYIGSQFHPVCRFNKKTRKMETLLPEGSLPDRVRVTDLYRDPDNRIWAGTSEGLCLFQKTPATLQPVFREAGGIGRAEIRKISPSSERNICWVATDQGVYRLHMETGVLAHYHTGSNPALSGDDIRFVLEDSMGKVWIGTNGEGVNILSAERKTVQRLTRAGQGLANDIVFGMLPQDNGNMWISTYNGLSCYSPHTGRFVNYYESDGLTHNNFNWNACLKGADGRMYFGTGNGLNAFYPDSLEVSDVPPPRLFVSPVSRWDSAEDSVSFFEYNGDTGGRLQLSGPSSALIMNFGLTDYTDPEQNTFSYRLGGLSDDWVAMHGSVLRLNALPYGIYRLEVRGVNAKGIEAVNVLSFELHVKQPFYKTVWFYLLSGMLLAAVLAAMLWIKYRNLKRMQRLRLQIASDLHDEVGSILTEITLFSDNLLTASRLSPEERQDRIRKVAERSRDATASMSDILWAIDGRNDFSENLADRMREHAEHILLPLNIEFRFELAENDGRRKVSGAFRQQLFLIFKEALNNALKHAGPSLVSVYFRYEAEAFLLCVTNDGNMQPGISGTTGQGIRNMRMRASKIGAVLSAGVSDGLFVLQVEKKSHPIKMGSVHPANNHNFT